MPGYSSGALVGLIYFGGFTGIFFVLTIYFQDVLGYSPLLAGLAVTPFAAGSAVAAAAGGYLVSRFGRLLVTVGLTTVLVCLVVVDLVLARVSAPSLGWALAVPLLVAGLGSGLVISPNVTLTLADVPVPRAGTAGGLLATGQRIGTAAGIALIGAVYFSVSAARGPRVPRPARAGRCGRCGWQRPSSPSPSWRVRSTSGPDDDRLRQPARRTTRSTSVRSATASRRRRHGRPPG